MVAVFGDEWGTRYDLIAERKCRYELNYMVQTRKRCKAYHKRAAAGKEEICFRDPRTFVRRGGLETNNTKGSRAVQLPSVVDRRNVVSVSELNCPKPPVYSAGM